ncbi:hypothetical protein BZG36_05355, partial [Bifiguratus adelaidae]
KDVYQSLTDWRQDRYYNILCPIVESVLEHCWDLCFDGKAMRSEIPELNYFLDAFARLDNNMVFRMAYRRQFLIGLKDSSMVEKLVDLIDEQLKSITEPLRDDNLVSSIIRNTASTADLLGVWHDDVAKLRRVIIIGIVFRYISPGLPHLQSATFLLQRILDNIADDVAKIDAMNALNGDPDQELNAACAMLSSEAYDCFEKLMEDGQDVFVWECAMSLMVLWARIASVLNVIQIDCGIESHLVRPGLRSTVMQACNGLAWILFGTTILAFPNTKQRQNISEEVVARSREYTEAMGTFQVNENDEAILRCIRAKQSRREERATHRDDDQHHVLAISYSNIFEFWTDLYHFHTCFQRFFNSCIRSLDSMVRHHLNHHDRSHLRFWQPAPADIVLQNQNNEEVRLADLIGRKPVILFFYPRDNTPGCTKQVCAFRDSYEVFTKKGAEVIGISSDSADSHKKFATAQRVPYHILADVKGEARKAFQVPKSLGLLPGRVTFVIDKEGIIRDYFNSQLDIQGHVKTATNMLENHEPYRGGSTEHDLSWHYHDKKRTAEPSDPESHKDGGTSPKRLKTQEVGLSDDVATMNNVRTHENNQVEKTPEEHDSVDDGEINLEPEIDEDALIAERRRRREAILAKYKQSSTSASPGTPNPSIMPSTIANRESSAADVHPRDPSLTPINTPAESNSPLALEKTETAAASLRQHDADSAPTDTKSPSVTAADYDPSEDRKQDDQRRHMHEQGNGAHIPLKTQKEIDLLKAKDLQENVVSTPTHHVDMSASDYQERLEGGKETGDTGVLAMSKSQPQSGPKEVDMFADDIDDMFAAAANFDPNAVAVQPTLKTEKKAAGDSILEAAPVIVTGHAGLVDNWDDSEGYYRVILGEMLDNRYHVYANLGRGVFSSVVKARDTTKGDLDVAIKFIRNNETMTKAAEKEIKILNKLAEADPDDKKHVIRLLRTFQHKGHTCLVFESLAMNLREVLKRFGKDVGITIQAVRVYAQQLFLALSLLSRCEILHADIKPDNILVNEQKNALKLCDLGSASDARENDITPYLVSRFYRAPEISLPYDHSIDVWSVGCTLYELYTGKILFPGRSNNQMLRLMMEVKGKFPNRMLKKGAFSSQHFEDGGTFLAVETDRLTQKEVTKKITITKATKDLKTRLHAAPGTMSDEETRLLNAFIDLLDKALTLTPDKRITAKEALAHPFLTGKL